MKEEKKDAKVLSQGCPFRPVVCREGNCTLWSGRTQSCSLRGLEDVEIALRQLSFNLQNISGHLCELVAKLPDLRDEFAGRALQSLIARGATVAFSDEDQGETIDDCVKLSFILADAMIRGRKGKEA